MEKKWFFRKENWKIISSFPKLPDGNFKITPVKNTRSLNQNKLYWGYILKIIILQYKDFWYIYTVDNLHEIFKKVFIPKKRIKSDFSRKFVYLSGSTSDLNTKQFSDYIERIKAIFEFWEMEKLWLEKIDSFVIPDIDNDDLLYRESLIV